MKFAAIVLLAVLGVANASLREDIDDILALIPREEIKAVFREYYANDASVQNAVAYLKSAEFQSIVQTVRDTAEWQDAKDYLDGLGIKINELVEKLYDLLGWSQTFDASRASRVLNRGMHDFFNDVLALIPVDDITALVKEKLETSAAFQELWAGIRSDKFRAIVQAVAANSEAQNLVQKAYDHGIPMDRYIEVLRRVLGWE